MTRSSIAASRAFLLGLALCACDPEITWEGTYRGPMHATGQLGEGWSPENPNAEPPRVLSDRRDVEVVVPRLDDEWCEVRFEECRLAFFTGSEHEPTQQSWASPTQLGHPEHERRCTLTLDGEAVEPAYAWGSLRMVDNQLSIEMNGLEGLIRIRADRGQ